MALSMDLGRYRKHLDAVPVPVRTPHSLSYVMCSKKYKSWLSVQMGRAKFALGTSLGSEKAKTLQNSPWS